MLFWIVAALLTLGASLAVLLPLAGRGTADRADDANDIEVYRDQLAEIERDSERGLIQPPEAEQARAEIARRILKADAENRTAGSGFHGTADAIRLAAASAVLAVPLVSWGLYIALGSPDLPSQPLAERLAKNPADSSLDELVARAEGHLAANPSDGKGWDVLAPIYFRLGRVDESINAFRNAIRLAGSTAAREAGLGEALAAAAAGMISSDARAAFERALALEPGQPKAAYYLAIAMAQEGRYGDAVVAWERMLPTLPTDSSWRSAVEQAIAEAAARSAAANAAGPGQDEIEAAAAMPEAERQSMIETMVASLDEKLRREPHDPEGWMRLVRSYVVLGRTDAAREAVKRGEEALGAGSEDARKLVAFSGTLGLSATD